MKLLEFQKNIGAIKKDKTNPHFKSTYATLTQIISEVKPILSECGVLLTQPIRDGKVGTVLQDEKGILTESWIDLPLNLTPQQLGSAITYYRRYTLASLLSLEIEEDDANLVSIKQASKPSVTEKTLGKMLDAINNGQRDAVIKAMDNYSFTPEQALQLKTTLNAKK